VSCTSPPWPECNERSRGASRPARSGLSQRDEIRQTKRDLAIVGNESFGFLATLVTSRQGFSSGLQSAKIRSSIVQSSSGITWQLIQRPLATLIILSKASAQLPVWQRKRNTRGGYSNIETVLIAEVDSGREPFYHTVIRRSASPVVSPHCLPELTSKPDGLRKCEAGISKNIT
jgi:hypothetical protein